MVFLVSPAIRKDDYARQVAREDGIAEGLAVCVLSCVRPCRTFEILPLRRQMKMLRTCAAQSSQVQDSLPLLHRPAARLHVNGDFRPDFRFPCKSA